MATTTTPAAGTSTQSTLSEWAGPYVTGMLGKAQALSEQPYQVYGGPMTAGESALQSKYFSGLGSLTFPTQLGKSFSSTTAPNLPGFMSYAQPIAQQVGKTDNTKTLEELEQAIQGIPLTHQVMEPYSKGSPVFETGIPPAYAGVQRPDQNRVLETNNTQYDIKNQQPIGSAQSQAIGIAEQYMNPYLQAVLAPQLEELRRQASITQQGQAGKAAQAGAFGGSRYGLMEAEGARNLMQEMNKTIGTGYANAYDKAMQQFNAEQGQAKTLADMMASAGAQQRGIEQEGITADYNEFLAQRDYPMKQVQFLQSMLQGLPISTVSTSQAQQSGIGQLASTAGALGSTYDLLKKLGVIPG